MWFDLQKVIYFCYNLNTWLPIFIVLFKLSLKGEISASLKDCFSSHNDQITLLMLESLMSDGCLFSLLCDLMVVDYSSFYYPADSS